MNKVVLYLQILEEEVRRISAIGGDAAHFGGSNEDILRPFPGIELPHGGCVEQVQLGVRTADQVREAAALQLAPQGAPGQTAVACHINPSVSIYFHASRNRPVRRGRQEQH